MRTWLFEKTQQKHSKRDANRFVWALKYSKYGRIWSEWELENVFKNVSKGGQKGSSGVIRQNKKINVNT